MIDREWQDAAEAHEGVIRRYLDQAAALDVGMWHRPVAEGKWSPAQITDHLVKTYEILLGQLRGGDGLHVQTSGVARGLFWSPLLRMMLRLQWIPSVARAPKALVPEAIEETREAALERLRRGASQLERELYARRNEAGLGFTHHLFGRLEALRGVRFATLHTDHHRKQLPVGADRTGDQQTA
jgi:hypothetical protein